MGAKTSLGIREPRLEMTENWAVISGRLRFRSMIFSSSYSINLRKELMDIWCISIFMSDFNIVTFFYVKTALVGIYFFKY